MPSEPILVNSSISSTGDITAVKFYGDGSGLYNIDSSVINLPTSNAPHQGLVFDGTAGATYSNITLGTGDFTVAVWARVPATSAGNRLLLGSTNGDTALFLDTAGLATIYIAGQSTHKATAAVPNYKPVLIVYTRSGTSGTFYQNAVSNGTVTDSNNYSTAWSYLGAYSAGAYLTGTLFPLVYNRALSAAEIVTLYESGVSSGVDYPATAAGTTLNSSVWVNNNYSAFSSASGATLSATYSGSGIQYAYAAPTFLSKYGNVIRFYYDLTLTSGQVPYVILTQIGVKSCSATANLVAGTGNYVDLTINDPSAATTIAINNTAASSWSIANAKLVPLGLLLAPDAAQAGGGLVWYDTSGNATNIILPANGVRWNVPSSGNWGGILRVPNTTASTSTSTGALVVSGGAGVAGAVNVGGTVTATGGVTVGITSQITNTATVVSGTRLTLDTQAQQGIDIFRSDANANYSGIRFRNSTNSATNSQIGWNGTTLRLDAAALSATGSLTIDNETVAGVNSASVPGAFNFTGYGWNTNVGPQQIGIRLDPIFQYWSAPGSNSPFGQTYPDLAFTFRNSDAGGTYSEKMRLTGSGNLLIGGTGNIAGSGGIKIFGTTASTSTSSGALIVSGGAGVAGALYVGEKLNLSTHTTSAGGIGFGTDVSLYRSGANTLTFDTSGNAAVLNVRENATLTAAIGTVTGDLYLQTQQAGKNVYIKTGNAATALTLNGSQQVQVNATTASTSTSSGALVVSGGVGVAGAINAGSYITAKSDTGGAIIKATQLGGSYASNTAAFEAVAENTTSGANNRAFGALRSGDTAYRSIITCDGSVFFGSGSASPETSLSRNSAGQLTLDHGGGSAPALSLSANGSVQSRFFSNGSNTFLESFTNTPLILRTNQTTALTITTGQQVQVNATTASTSTSTGALVVSGGVGVAGAIYAGGTLTVNGKIRNDPNTSISGDVAGGISNLSATGYGLRVQGGASGSGYILSANDYTGSEKFQIAGSGNATIGGTLAVNGTGGITASNLTLGTSGPSVKSTLSARAPRQGLVFDGTTGASITTPAPGSGDFTFSVIFKAPTISASTYAWLFGGNASCGIAVWSSGIRLTKVNIVEITAFFTAFNTTSWYHLVVTKSSGIITAYVDGVQLAGSYNDSAGTYSASTIINGYGGPNSFQTAVSVISPLIYNRALSAAEVLALYEAGAPAAADYGAAGVPASNTSLVTGDDSTFSSDTGWWIKNAGATISGGVGNIASAGQYIGRAALMTYGKKYRVTFTKGGTGTIELSDLAVQSYGGNFTTAGTYTLELTYNRPTLGYFAFNWVSGVSTIDDVTIYPIGVVLAPDATQAGSGLTWYDTSGNSANITLPASGASWNIPTSGNSITGVVQINQGGTGQTTRVAALNALLPDQTGNAQYVLQTDGAGNVGWTAQSAGGVTELPSQTSNGGKLLTTNGTAPSWSGAVTVSGNNATVAGTLTVNGTGGRDFTVGTDYPLTEATPRAVISGTKTTNANGLISGGLAIWDTTSGNGVAGVGGALTFEGNMGGGVYKQLAAIQGLKEIATNTDTRGKLVFSTRTLANGALSTALTLDSSQNATFAGAIILSNNIAQYWNDSTGTTRRMVLLSGLNDSYFGPIDVGWGGVTNIHSGSSISIRTNGNSGTFTTAATISNSGVVSVLSSTAATSTSSGALVVSGGVGVAGSAYVGGNTNAFGAGGTGGANSQLILEGGSAANGGGAILYRKNGTVKAYAGMESSILGGGSTSDNYIIYTSSGLALTVAGQQVQANATTASTSTSTGALVVSGGVGVAGALYVGSKGQFQSNDDALSLKYSTDGGSCLLAWKNTSGTTLWSIGGGIDTRQDELVFRRGSTTVLNLNNSNNATFAGTLEVNGYVGIKSGNPLRIYTPSNSGYSSVTMGADNVVSANYIWSFANGIRIPDTTASTSTSTGALVVSGGLGVAEVINAGEVRATGNVTAYYSDERLKTKIGAIENPIEKVLSLSGFYFVPNDTAMALGYQKKVDIGVSAQEVQKILPEIIAPAPIDPQYMTVRYEKMIPLLIEAIKAQQSQIEELKSLVSELTNK